jgi:hypothetical protein
MSYNSKAIDRENYKNYSKDFFYVYNRTDFLETLSHQTPKIHYLTIGDTKPRVVLFIAEYEDKIVAPYSAPFWNIEKIKKNLSIDSIDEIITVLAKYLDGLKKEIRLILAPFFYDSAFLTQILNCFLRKGFSIEYADINHYLDINHISLNSYIDSLAPNARRNLRIANDLNLCFVKATTETEVREAYEIISVNREVKGYPLKLSFDQLNKTLTTIGGNVFLVSQKDNFIASAFVFNINKFNKQLIYWGDIPATSETKSMNFLAYKLIEYYKSKNIQFLDLGPSSENGVPNYGLSNFKESIGASVSLKPTLIKLV